MRRVHRAISVLLLLHLLAGPAAAQRLAPARFAPVRPALAISADTSRAAGAAEGRFSTPLFILSGLAGGLVGAYFGARAQMAHEDSGVPLFFFGAALGFGAGATLYALTHLGSAAHQAR